MYAQFGQGVSAANRSQRPRPPGEPVLQKGGKEFQDKTKKPEEQRAKAELQGELDSATQKDSPVTKSVIIVAHYNSVIGVQSAGNFCNADINGDRTLVNSLGYYNFEQAEKAAAIMEIEQQAGAAASAAKLEQVEIAVASAPQVDGHSSPPKGGVVDEAESAPPKGGGAGEDIEYMSDP